MKIIIILTILCTHLVLAASINEIMYNPEGNDNNREFIEIKGTNNLSNYIIGDSSSNDTLKLLSFQKDSNFALIVEEEFNYTNINASIYSAGPTIGNNLDNNGDAVYLYFNNTLVDSVTYSDTLANNNNLSLQLINNEWIESPPTPGSENILIIKEKPKQECSFSIKTDKEVYSEGEVVEFWYEIQPPIDEFSISYWITDLFGNFVRDEKNTTNDNKKYFTPKVYGSENVYQIHSILSPCQANATQNIIVKGTKESESYIKIKSLSENESIMFGDTIWINLIAYKGESKKSSLYLYIKKKDIDLKLTEASKFDLDTNYQKYKFSVPLKIPYNCNNKYQDGNYELVVEGLDVVSTEEIIIEGTKTTICKEKKTKEKEEKTKETFELISYPENISLNQDFQIKVFLQNNEEEKEFRILSYLYSGPISLSGERESNLQTITLPENANITTTLNLKALDYKKDSKLKIKIEYKDSVKEITRPITISQLVEESNSNLSTFSAQKQEITQNKPSNEITSYTIHESPIVKTKELSLYIFGILLLLLGTWFILKNGITNKNNSGSGGISRKPRQRSN